MQAAFAEPNPACVKAALALQGLIGNEVRDPMRVCTCVVMGRLRGILAELAE
jgi:4-hydroxy-tetrahydrodipicolinate synthase